MNLILIPLVVSIVIACIFAVTAGIGLVLRLDQSTASAGKSLLRYSVVPSLAGIVFAWASLPLAAGLSGLTGSPMFGDRLGILVLWVSGPIGVGIGLLDTLVRNRRGS